jgi:hypothetical protein
MANGVPILVGLILGLVWGFTIGTSSPLGPSWMVWVPRGWNVSWYVMIDSKRGCVPTSVPNGPRWPWGHHGGQGWWGYDTTKCGSTVWKESATKKALDMFGSLHLTIGYLIRRYKGNKWWRPVSKSWAEMKALVVNTNIGCEGHVQGWCIEALINVS